MRLRGEVAIVTGGGNGIGLAYAMRLAEEGAKVAVADLDGEAADRVAQRITEAGGEALALRTDIADPASATEMAQRTAERFGGIHILVNNAAIFGRIPLQRAPFWEIPLAEWERMMRVNVTGAWLCVCAVLPFMRQAGRGKIINQSSIAFHVGAPNFLHYVASRGAIIGMTRAMARELGEYNITVNSIAPGATVADEDPDPARVEFCKHAIPRRAIKRLEYAADLVGTAVFLASRDSDFITGQTIIVDGGIHMI